MANQIEPCVSLEPVRRRSARIEASQNRCANAVRTRSITARSSLLGDTNTRHRWAVRRHWQTRPFISIPQPIASNHMNMAADQSMSHPYKTFFIPLPILFETAIFPQHGSKLLQLPGEILTLILEQVKVPYFQICFALTCKTVGRVASRKNVLSPWRGYRDKDGLFRLLERNHYMPPQLRLCRACFLFLPWDRDYWDRQMKLHDYPYDKRSGNWCDILNWFDPSSYWQHRCPRCCINGYTSYMSEKKFLDDTSTIVNVDGIGVGVGVGAAKFVCPELWRRMNKP